MKNKKAYYSILYFIREGIDNIFLHGMMSVASITLLIACLIVFGTFTLVVLNINLIVNDIGRSHEIIVFVDDTVSYVDTRMLGAEIEAIDGVGEAVFISREKGLKDFKTDFSEYPDILDGLDDDNPLRDSYQISIDDLSKSDEIERSLQLMPEVAKTSVRSDIIRTFVEVRNVISGIAIVLGGLLCVLGVFIISNAIRLSAFSRRDEIAIMRMVGATSGTIRLSFLVEGLVIGFFGSGFAFITQWAIYEGLIVPRIETLKLFTMVSFESVGYYLLGGFMLVGLLMGFFGSNMAIHKYLKA